MLVDSSLGEKPIDRSRIANRQRDCDIHGDSLYSDHNVFLAMSETLHTQIQLSPDYSKAAAKYNDKEERTLLEIRAGRTGGGISAAPCTKADMRKDKDYAIATRCALQNKEYLGQFPALLYFSKLFLCLLQIG